MAHGRMRMRCGRVPTGIVVLTFRVVVFTTAMALLASPPTHSSLPSGVRASPWGLPGTATVASETVIVEVLGDRAGDVVVRRGEHPPPIVDLDTLPLKLFKPGDHVLDELIGAAQGVRHSCALPGSISKANV